MIFVLLNIIPCFNTNFRDLSQNAFIFLNNPLYIYYFMKLFMFEIMLVKKKKESMLVTILNDRNPACFYFTYY